jgi:NADPH2:quinone reductase
VTSAADLFDVVHSGDVKIEVRQTFELKDATEAHRALASRATKGSSILLP